MANTEIIIKLSKTKIALLSFGSIALVFASIWILSFADQQNRYDPAILKLIAYISIVLFTCLGVYGLIKIFDQKPGLIINKEGLIDNSSAVSAGLIKWKDIVKLEVIEIHKNKSLLIFVHQNDEFLNRATGLKKQIMKMNANMYGTPLSLSSNTLQYKFDDLVVLINQEWEKHVQ